MRNKIVNHYVNEKMPLNLQFFAKGSDDGAEGGDNGGEEEDDEPDDDDPDDNGSDDGAGEDEKKFTQKDMSATAAKEKKQGRRAAFKEMGFKSEKDAIAKLKEFKKWQESQLSEDEKHQQQIKETNDAKTAAEQRAQEAEEKLAVVVAGVRKDSIDDVLAIARVKVDEDTTLDDVLNDMKTQERYKSFFATSDDEPGSKGTGGNLSHKKNGKKSENIGARLAKQNKEANTKKSSYFK